MPMGQDSSCRGDMSKILTPVVCVYIHPVDISQHPSYQPGYRWAVMVGGTSPGDLSGCVQAGHQATPQLAAMMGEQVGVAVTLGLRKFGINASYHVKSLAFDPIPSEADDIPLGVFTADKEQTCHTRH